MIDLEMSRVKFNFSDTSDSGFLIWLWNIVIGMVNLPQCHSQGIEVLSRPWSIGVQCFVRWFPWLAKMLLLVHWPSVDFIVVGCVDKNCRVMSTWEEYTGNALLENQWSGPAFILHHGVDNMTMWWNWSNWLCHGLLLSLPPQEVFSGAGAGILDEVEQLQSEEIEVDDNN